MPYASIFMGNYQVINRLQTIISKRTKAVYFAALLCTAVF